MPFVSITEVKFYMSSMQKNAKVIAAVVFGALLFGVAGCSAPQVKVKSETAFSVSQAAAPQASAVDDQSPTPMTLYAAIGKLEGADREILISYAQENYRRIFEYQVNYINETKASSTNVILPTGHTVYENENGKFIFSGDKAVYIYADESPASSLKNPNNPLYNPEIMRDVLKLDGSQLRDENGVILYLESGEDFKEVDPSDVSFNNVIVNASFAFELLDSTTLNLPLAEFGVADIETAKALYTGESADDKKGGKAEAKPAPKTIINGVSYAKIVDNDVFSIFFDGSEGFVVDFKTLYMPRQQNESGMIDFNAYTGLVSKLYTSELNAMGITPAFAIGAITPNVPVTVYDSATGKILPVTLLNKDDEGKLSISLEAAQKLFGISFLIDEETKTLHVYTDPTAYALTQHFLGNPATTDIVKSVTSQNPDEAFVLQQEERYMDDSYIYEEAMEQSSLRPTPVIRTPKSGQITYPAVQQKFGVPTTRAKASPPVFTQR